MKVYGDQNRNNGDGGGNAVSRKGTEKGGTGMETYNDRSQVHVKGTGDRGVLF